MDRILATPDGAETGWVLAPDARLDPGAVVSVGVGTWMRGAASGLTLEAPFTEMLVVSDAPEAGATVTASWPPDGAAAVPRDIARLAVRFDGPVDGLRDGLTLVEGEDGSVDGVARPMPCEVAGWTDGWCASFEPGASLAAGGAYRLRVGEQVVDATGAPVGPWEARFTTSESDADPAPMLLPLTCGLDEQPLEAGGCVLADDAHLVLRMQASEPVRVALSIAGRTLLDVAPRGSATLAVDALPPDTELDAVLRVTDLGEQVVETPLTLHTTESLSTVSIVEVRSDPLGPEPRQEYVEVLNYGAMPVDLLGLSISDRVDSEGDAVPRSQILAPGQRALLVADGFDPEDPSDPPVPAAVPLVRVGRSLATGGITNAGEALYLRDESLHRLSATPAVETGPGHCLVRVGDDERSGDPSLFEVADTCTPGVESSP